MEDKNKLLEMLNDIIEVAKTKENELSMEEIKSFLNGIELNDSQINIVFDYLIANKIRIKGYINPENEFVNSKNIDNTTNMENNIKDSSTQQSSNLSESHASINSLETFENNFDESEGREENTSLDTAKLKKEEDEEKEFLDMYLSDIEAIPVVPKEEIDQLVIRYKKDDELAKSKLVECFLKNVVNIAKEYRNHGITIADLIQEGNIGLMQALSNYKDSNENSDMTLYLENGIRSNITDAIYELDNSKNFAKRMAERLDNLYQNINELKEDLGKKPTIKELADFMELDVEEVKDLIRMSKEEDLEIDYKGLDSKN